MKINKNYIIIFIILLLLNCTKSSYQFHDRPDNRGIVFLPKEIFGLDIGKINTNLVINRLREKSIDFVLYEYNSDYDGFPRRTVIETNYFIGAGLNNEQISKVRYDFGYINLYMFIPQNIIEIHFKKSYYEDFLDLLLKQYGPYGIDEVIQGETKLNKIFWSNIPGNDSNFIELSIIQEKNTDEFIFIMR